MKKIAVVLGTRPEIIKLSSIIRELGGRKVPFFIIHTNQHYSIQLNEIFFKELDLPLPNYNLNVGSGLHGEQTGKMLIKIEKVLIRERPDVVIVQGDTNSAFAGAIAAAKLRIPVAHIEAGLRSGDMKMPEEMNRIMIDHISEYLFAPTSLAKQNLLKENIAENKIFVVGNTVVDSLLENISIAEKKVKKLIDEEYILLTIHRAENVDDLSRFKYLLSQIEKVSNYYKIIFPIHPRTKKQLDNIHYNFTNNVLLIEPQSYLQFLSLLKYAKVVLTDSGGIQEEACILKVPCITLRTSTERPETIEVGANKLMSNDLLSDIKEMIQIRRAWGNPFGKNVSSKIVEVLL